MLNAVNQLREKGHTLWRHGITIKDFEYHCEPCKKTTPWYEVFNEPPHFETKNHVRYKNGTIGDIPPQTWEGEYKSRWQQMMSPGSFAGDPAPSAASPPKREVLPSPER